MSAAERSAVSQPTGCNPIGLAGQATKPETDAFAFNTFSTHSQHMRHSIPLVQRGGDTQPPHKPRRPAPRKGLSVYLWLNPLNK